ncbi:MAG: hypothetical protein AB8C13_03465 [Phycisphaerales bacterium]
MVKKIAYRVIFATFALLVSALICLLVWSYFFERCEHPELASRIIYGHSDALEQIEQIEVIRFNPDKGQSPVALIIDDPESVRLLLTQLGRKEFWPGYVPESDNQRISGFKLNVHMTDERLVKLILVNDWDLNGQITLGCQYDLNVATNFARGLRVLMHMIEVHEEGNLIQPKG